MADEKKPVFLIGVTGGTCCGKTTVCQMIMDNLQKQQQDQRVCILSQDCFYRTVPDDEAPKASYDHPEAFDFDLMIATLAKIKKGEEVQVRPYNYKTESADSPVTVKNVDLVILEGILVLYNKTIRHMLDLKVFVDMDSDLRLSRRVLRDVNLGRDLDASLSSYINQIKPCFEEFTLPTKKYADVILPRGSENTVAIDLLGQHLHYLINEKVPASPEEPQTPPVIGQRVRHNSITRPH
eukprot:m.69091 g.69091  ORF g.69091 m.69091 type:complete len:238 (+) comp14224_c0_seq1:307-1020(+)